MYFIKFNLYQIRSYNIIYLISISISYISIISYFRSWKAPERFLFSLPLKACRCRTSARTKLFTLAALILMTRFRTIGEDARLMA